MLDLARENGWHIHEVEALSSAELSEWMAYYRIESEDREKRSLTSTAQNGATTRARKALRK